MEGMLIRDEGGEVHICWGVVLCSGAGRGNRTLN